MRQLVRPGVIVVSPEFRKDHVYDEDAVVERYGLPPRLLPQMKALAGDPSDKVPGAPGIGVVTATNVLQHYRSLKRVLVAAVSGAKDWPDTKRRQRIIAEHARDIILYLKLTTIQDHFPWIRGQGERDQRRVIEYLRKYRFRSLEVPSELEGLMRLSEK
jgi:DNA polymerase-1